MTPFVGRYISEAEVALFEKISSAVRRMSDLDLGSDQNGKSVLLSCHMLARAVARVFSLRVADGFLYPRYQHSWVLTHEGHIIDVYPVAVLGGPILVEGKSSFSPSKQHYLKAPRNFYRGRFGKKDFRQGVNRIANELVKVSLK